MGLNAHGRFSPSNRELLESGIPDFVPAMERQFDATLWIAVNGFRQLQRRPPFLSIPSRERRQVQSGRTQVANIVLNGFVRKTARQRYSGTGPARAENLGR